MGDGRDNSQPGLELELDLSDLDAVPRSGHRPLPEATRVGKVDAALLAREKNRAADDQQTAAPVSDLGEDPRIAAMRELYAAGDAESALVVASTLQARLTSEGDEPHPADRDDHTSVSDSGVKLASLASLTGVPRLLVSEGEVSRLPLDHRAGFLLAHVDGRSSMEDILDVCAMSEGEALGIMKELVSMGVIAFA